MDGFSGVIAIGAVATVGFLMVRSFNARRARTGASSDSGSRYWAGSDDGSSRSSSDADRSDSGGWFNGLFSSSDSSPGSQANGSSSDSSNSDSGGGNAGGGGDSGGD